MKNTPYITTNLSFEKWQEIFGERFERLSATYEKEQKELVATISKAKQNISNADLKVFLKKIRKCTDVKKLKKGRKRCNRNGYTASVL